MAACNRIAPDTPEHLPPAPSLAVACAPWTHEASNSRSGDLFSPEPPCALIDHLKAGYGSYLHHAIHGMFKAQEKGLRLVPLLHHYARKEAVHHRLAEDVTTRQAFVVQRKNATARCQLALLSCVTGGAAETRCDFRKAPRIVMSGQARKRHPLPAVAAAALELLQPEHSPFASRWRRAARGQPCIGAQLRYGDSCGTNSFHTGRKCGPVADYASAVLRLHATYGYARVVVASDSSSKLAELGALLRPHGLAVETLSPPERLLGDSIVRRRIAMVEHVMISNSSAAWLMLETFLEDLYGLAACDALVAKFTSNMARLVLELMAARLGRVPPYISLDSAWCFGGRTLSPDGRGYFPC